MPGFFGKLALKYAGGVGTATGWGKRAAGGVGKFAKGRLASISDRTGITSGVGALKGVSGFAQRHVHGLTVTGGMGYGYATGEGDFTDRATRAVGFGLAGAVGVRAIRGGSGMQGVQSLGKNVMGMAKGRGIISNRVNPNATFRRVVQGYVKEGDQTFRKTIGFRQQMNRPGPRAAMIESSPWEARKAFGRAAAADIQGMTGVKRWTGAHSIAAGALYGVMSDDVGVLEGAITGGFMHAGGRFAAKGVQKYRQGGGSIVGAYKAGGIKGAFTEARKMPLIRTATGAGLAFGAYGAREEEGALGVTSGALKGALVGGGAATFGRAVVAHPLVTMGVLGPTAVAAGGAAEAYGNWEATGRPGFNDMEADGDLALALHKMRHGF